MQANDPDPGVPRPPTLEYRDPAQDRRRGRGWSIAQGVFLTGVTLGLLVICIISVRAGVEGWSQGRPRVAMVCLPGSIVFVGAAVVIARWAWRLLVGQDE